MATSARGADDVSASRAVGDPCSMIAERGRAAAIGTAQIGGVYLLAGSVPSGAAVVVSVGLLLRLWRQSPGTSSRGLLRR
jgi:hypothetical protein